VFVPAATARNTTGAPILLIIDGHGSHLSDEVITNAISKNVVIFLLPPKCTHKLQPLDVGIFNYVQRPWRDRCAKLAQEGQPISRSTFMVHYFDVRQQGFTAQHILTAWRRSGLHPTDPNVFTDADYAMSQATTTKATVPEHFYEHWVERPTSPLAAHFTSPAQRPLSDQHNSDDDIATLDLGEPPLDLENPPHPRSPEAWAKFLVLDIPDDSGSDGSDSDFDYLDLESDEMDSDVQMIEVTSQGGTSQAASVEDRNAVAHLPAPNDDGADTSKDMASAFDDSEQLTPLTPEEVLARPPVPPASPYVPGFFQSTDIAPPHANLRGISNRVSNYHGYTRSKVAPALQVPLEDASHEQLMAEVLRLRHEQVKADSVLSASHAHNTLLYRENKDLRTQFERKETSRKSKANSLVGGTMSVAMGPLTAPEQHAYQEKRIADNAAAAAQKKDAEQTRAAKLVSDKEARFATRCDAAHTWSGTWKSFLQGAKNTMMTLADELLIAYTESDKKQTIGEAVARHFDAHSDDLLKKPRYATLVRSYKGITVPRGSRGQPAVASSQDASQCKPAQNRASTQTDTFLQHQAPFISILSISSIPQVVFTMHPKPHPFPSILLHSPHRRLLIFPSCHRISLHKPSHMLIPPQAHTCLNVTLIHIQMPSQDPALRLSQHVRAHQLSSTHLSPLHLLPLLHPIVF